MWYEPQLLRATMYYLLTCLSKLLGLMPHRLQESFASGIAFILFDIIRLRRKLMLNNLNIAFGDKYTASERVRLARKSYKNFILSLFEFLLSKREAIAGKVRTKGEHHLKDALKKGQGVYILCCHLGNWEAMGSYINKNIAPAHVLVKKVGSGAVNRFVEENRIYNDFKWVKRRKKGDGFNAIKDILDRGEIVGFVMDQARPGEPRLPFFGKPAKTNTSFAAIWSKRPAPIIPAFIHREGIGDHVFEVLPEIDLPIHNTSKSEILKSSIQFNKQLESMVRRYPEHYFWHHDRWK